MMLSIIGKCDEQASKFTCCAVGKSTQWDSPISEWYTDGRQLLTRPITSLRWFSGDSRISVQLNTKKKEYYYRYFLMLSSSTHFFQGTIMLFFYDTVAFALLYSMGTIVALASSMFLRGPVSQVKSMCKEKRIVATIMMLVSTVTC